MINRNIVVAVALLVGVTGCVSEYKKEGKEEQAAKVMPVNCKTAQGDIRMLTNEKANVGKEAAAGVTAIVPIGLVAGLVTGTEGQTSSRLPPATTTRPSTVPSRASRRPATSRNPAKGFLIFSGSV